MRVVALSVCFLVALRRASVAIWCSLMKKAMVDVEFDDNDDGRDEEDGGRLVGGGWSRSTGGGVMLRSYGQKR